jgi:hypothetical protein
MVYNGLHIMVCGGMHWFVLVSKYLHWHALTYTGLHCTRLTPIPIGISESTMACNGLHRCRLGALVTHVTLARIKQQCSTSVGVGLHKSALGCDGANGLHQDALLYISQH